MNRSLNGLNMREVQGNVVRIDVKARTLFVRSSNAPHCPEAAAGITITFAEKNAFFHLGILALILRKYKKSSRLGWVKVCSMVRDVELLAKHSPSFHGDPITRAQWTIRSHWYKDRGLDLQKERAKYRVLVGDVRTPASDVPDSIADLFGSLVSVARTPDKPEFQMNVDLQRCGDPVRIDLPHFDDLLNDLTQRSAEPLVARRDSVQSDFNEELYKLNQKAILEEDVTYRSRGTTQIDSVYRLRFLPVGPGNHGMKGELSDAVSVDDLLSTSVAPVVVLTGTPGAGKTTSLQYLAWRECTHGQSLPVYLKCTPRLFSDVARHLRQYGGGRWSADAIMEEMERRPMTFFLDGYDDLDLQDRAALRSTLVGDCRAFYKTCRFVISTRDCDSFQLPQQSTFSANSPEDVVSYLCAHGMTRRQADSIITRLEAHRAFSILKSPMLLWFVVLIGRTETDVSAGQSTGALVQTVMDDYFYPEMLSKWRVARLGLGKESLGDITGCLGLVAFELIDSGSPLTESAMKKTIQKYYKGRRYPRELAENLFELATYQQFVERTDKGLYAFAHNMYRDYFAALHIATNHAIPDAGWSIQSLAERLKWDSALTLAGGLSSTLLDKPFLEAICSMDLALGIDIFIAGNEKAKADPALVKAPTQIIWNLCCEGAISMDNAIGHLGRLGSVHAIELLHVFLDLETERAKGENCDDLHLSYAVCIALVMQEAFPPHLVSRHRLAGCFGISAELDEILAELKAKAGLNVTYVTLTPEIRKRLDAFPPSMSCQLDEESERRLFDLIDYIRAVFTNLRPKGCSKSPAMCSLSQDIDAIIDYLILESAILKSHFAVMSKMNEFSSWLERSLETVATYADPTIVHDVICECASAAKTIGGVLSVPLRQASAFLLYTTGRRFGGALPAAAQFGAMRLSPMCLFPNLDMFSKPYKLSFSVRMITDQELIAKADAEIERILRSSRKRQSRQR